MSEKRKRDNLPAKLPSVYWHMMSWGAVSGYFLAWGFLFLLVRFQGSTPTVADILSALIQGVFIFGVLGAIPGIIMGTLMGAYIKNRLKKRSTAHAFEDIALNESQLKRRDFAIVFLIAFVLMSLVMLVSIISLVQATFGGGALSITEWIIAFMPPLIAGIAATYAAHRYMIRLRRWAKFTHENTPKSKRESQAKGKRLASDNDSEALNDMMHLHNTEADMKANQQ